MKPVNCLAARPVGRAPKVALPPASWDCHAHVFGPVDRFPYRDVSLYTPPEASLEQYLRLLDTLGFAFGVLVQPSTYAYDRACLTDAIARSSGRLKGVAYFSLAALSSASVAQCHADGIRGVRINAALPAFTPAFIREVAGAIAPFGWHISLQVKAIDQLVFLEPTLSDLPCRIVVEAMGKMPADSPVTNDGFAALLRLLEAGHVFVKLSHVYKLSRLGIPYHDASWIARELIKANPDAVIFGTDWPHPLVDPMPYDEDLIDLALDWTPSTDLREKLWVRNPGKLYGF